MTTIDDIFLIPHRRKFLLHAPRHGVTSLINASTAAEVRQGLVSGQVGDTSAAARRLLEPLFREPVPVPTRSGPFAPRTLSLLPTTDCNMRCLYCAPAAGAADAAYMPVEICRAALRYQADVVRRERLKCLMLYYFGGEPFVAWDLVRFCDAAGRELAGDLGVPFWSACTTNAFMAEDRARWVAQHLTFALVSMDGFPELHDHYRPTVTGKPTHQVVKQNLHVFQEEGMNYALRCSVDDVIVGRLAAITEYFCTEFRPVAINLEPLVQHGRCLETGLKTPEPAEFVRAIVEAGRVAREHGMPLKLTTAQTERMAQSNCEVADDNFVVAPDGLIATCYGANHRGSPHEADYAVGEIDRHTFAVSIDPAKVEKNRTYGVSNIPRCRGCFAKWHCSGGCRLFHTPPGSEEPENDMCKVTQKLTLWRILEHLTLYDEADQVSLN